MCIPVGINLTVRRRDTKYIIDADPWSITAYRRGETRDDPVQTFTMTGTLMPASSRAISRATSSGEAPVGMSLVLLLLKHDADVLQNDDEVRAVQDSTDIERNFIVVADFGQNGYKQEIILDERD